VGIVPFGYGLYPEELENDTYPQIELVRAGKRAGKVIQISLSDPIWKDRAVLWCQALHVLLHFVY
jgi:hypothetical protein